MSKMPVLFRDNGAVRDVSDRPLFSRAVSVDKDQMVFLDIYEKDDPDPQKFLSMSEWRKNDKEGFDHTTIHIRSKKTIQSVRDALNEVLTYLDSCGG